MRNFFAIAMATLFFAASHASAAGIIVGPLCLDGVNVTSHPNKRTVTATGYWTPTDYKLSGATGHLIVFNKPIGESEKLETCEEILERMRSAGSHAVVAGQISSLKLLVSVFTGNAGNRVQIDNEAFSATLVKVDHGEHPMAGGSIDFQGSKAWVRSSSDILSTATAIEGELEIETWNRTVKNARVAVPGGAEYRADLSPYNEGNLTVRLNLATDVATLWEGDLRGIPGPATAGNWRLPIIEADGAAVNAATLRVLASKGPAALSIGGLRGQANALRVLGKRLAWELPAASIEAGSLDGKALQSAQGFLLDAPVLRETKLRAAMASVQNLAGAHLVDGPLALDLALLSIEKIKGIAQWSMPTSAPLSPVFAAHKIANMRMDIDGSQAMPTMKMALDANAMRVGGIEIERAIGIASASLPLNLEIVLPVDIDLPAATGSVTVHDGQQTAILTGRLDAFVIKGSIVIPIDKPGDTRLEVGANDFRLAVGAAVSLSPFIVGSKPNFGRATLVFHSASKLVVGAVKSGQVIAAAATMVLGEPVIKVGDGGTQSRATLSLNAEGEVKLLYDLALSKMVIGQAKLTAKDLDFKLVDASPAVLDFNGDKLTDPSVKLAEMTIDIDHLGPVNLERAELKRLKATASSLRRERAAGQTDGMAYSGSLSNALSLASATAAQLKFDDALVLGAMELSDLAFEVTQANFDLGKGTTFSNAGLGLSVAKVTQIEFAGSKQNSYTNMRLGVAGTLGLSTPEFSVNGGIGTRLALAVDGPEQALNGIGSLQISAFTGNARSELEIGFKCKDSDKLHVPIEFNFGMGAGTFVATMKVGVLDARGSVGPIGVDLHTVGGSECDSPSEKLVVVPEARGWTDGICTQVWPPKVWRCRWEWRTDEVSLGYHIKLAIRFANIPVVMSNPHLFYSNGKMAVCNAGAVTVGPVVIVGGYSPQVETSFGGDGEKLINALIAANFESYQTLVATGIANGAGWLASTTLTTVGNALCIGRPL